MIDVKSTNGPRSGARTWLQLLIEPIICNEFLNWWSSRYPPSCSMRIIDAYFRLLAGTNGTWIKCLKYYCFGSEEEKCEEQITWKNLCHFGKKNLKISKKNSKIAKEILKSWKKNLEILKKILKKKSQKSEKILKSLRKNLKILKKILKIA